MLFCQHRRRRDGGRCRRRRKGDDRTFHCNQKRNKNLGRSQHSPGKHDSWSDPGIRRLRIELFPRNGIAVRPCLRYVSRAARLRADLCRRQRKQLHDIGRTAVRACVRRDPGKSHRNRPHAGHTMDLPFRNLRRSRLRFR